MKEILNKDNSGVIPLHKKYNVLPTVKVYERQDLK